MSKRKKILVTGGCGYIGSHTVVELLEAGYEVFSIDTNKNYKSVLSTIEQITGKTIQNYNVDLTDYNETRKALADIGGVDAVIHLAALKFIPESMSFPGEYYRNNLGTLNNVLSILEEKGHFNVVYSSSAAVYGENIDEDKPIKESNRLSSLSPYADTKRIGEEILSVSAGLRKLNAISLRYFNVGGFHESGLLNDPSLEISTGLFPALLKYLNGSLEKIVIYGDDYDTRDGSGLRDFIHVNDIARAHRMAAEKLMNIKSDPYYYSVLNLGSGCGVTVLELINTFEKHLGKPIYYDKGPRRVGDIPAIYADISKAIRILEWSPIHTLDQIVESSIKVALSK